MSFWNMSFWDELKENLKSFSWLVGAILLFIFVIIFYFAKPGSVKEDFAKSMITVLVGYVVGHQLGALRKSGWKPSI